MKSTIRSNAMDIMKENFRQSDDELSFEEYVKTCATNDPNFYSWLFEDGDNIGDFGMYITETQSLEAAEFFALVKVESHYLTAIA
jgi:hypothetical protein